MEFIHFVESRHSGQILLQRAGCRNSASEKKPGAEEDQGVTIHREGCDVVTLAELEERSLLATDGG